MAFEQGKREKIVDRLWEIADRAKKELKTSSTPHLVLAVELEAMDLIAGLEAVAVEPEPGDEKEKQPWE